jgi:glucokinase
MGCWEAEAAGPALARKAGFATAEDAVAAARAGDPSACRAVADVAGFMARGVANLVSALDPEMVVLGGGLMQAGDLFLPLVRENVCVWAQPRAVARTRIELTRLGERAGLLGAARLALTGGEV